MSKVCQISGKRFQTGNNVSHSNTKTKRKMQVNLQRKRLVNPATGVKMTVMISTSALRTLQKWSVEGKEYDLRKLIDQHA